MVQSFPAPGSEFTITSAIVHVAATTQEHETLWTMKPLTSGEATPPGGWVQNTGVWV